jgi:hypothetical protein
VNYIIDFIPNKFLCHSRVGGNPVITQVLDARLHGHDRPVY